MKTDTQLQLDVTEELHWEPSVHNTQIRVDVKDGIVTLAGHVGSYAEKWDTERAAQRISGVKALNIEIDVTLSGSSKRNDADIARTSEHVLQWMSNLRKNSIKVVVDSGWITLSGEVDWEFQRHAATDAVRYLIGVTGVSDHITIKNKQPSRVVKSDIENALKRRAITDMQLITVDVRDTDVTLTGTVRSWLERELARHSAWSTPGVRNVVDAMTIA